MATGWLRSLHCKSNSVDDVVYSRTPSSCSSLARKPLLSSVSCGQASHAVRDVIPSSPPKPKAKRSMAKTKAKQRPARPPPSPATGPRAAAVPFPTLEDLPAGQSSRRVVEIIFSSSWSSSSCGGSGAAFPGEIEMLFRVHNPARAVARFEECRAAARARADDVRCAADGNEMLRFHCGGGGGAGGVVYDAGVVRSSVWSGGKKVEGVRTFSGSGRAHASGGGSAGRRGMLVCRVVAGRVRAEPENELEAESVSLTCGELVVFDHRAVLPCFLIIYKF
ncbi:uncharacterized protein LOC121990627 [Zingiber officinale]|uniref:uncharacterized protein LOC121990627 n=1 Tax=Zingiber officinale TaxID=94328 RepID=UPI001C4CE65B|nr:uncharacterized protein LOC121990627 [Zingiber officinale]